MYALVSILRETSHSRKPVHARPRRRVHPLDPLDACLSMNAYLFHDLTRDAQENAISAYAFDPLVVELVNKRQAELEAQGSEDIYLAEYALDELGWLFNHLGERIA